MSDVYKVAITGPSLSLEREVSKEICDQLVVLLLTGQAPAASGAGASAHKAGGAAHQQELSLSEYISEYEAKRVPDKIVAIGSYVI